MLPSHGRLAGNSSFVKCHVIMNQPMNMRVVLTKAPAIYHAPAIIMFITYFCRKLNCRLFYNISPILIYLYRMYKLL